MAVIKKKDGRYFCVYYDDTGKQVWVPFGRGPEAKKRATAYDLEIKARKKKGYPIEEPEKIDITNLAAMYLEAKGNSIHRRTYNSIVFLINEIIYPILGGKAITSLKKKHLLEVIKKLEDRNISPATVNRYLSYLNAILNWGVQNEIITSNPFKGFKRKKETQYAIPILTQDELKRILGAAPEHLRWAVLVVFYTGCRPGESELFSLKWEDINWQEHTITIRGAKTGKIRKVFINDAFYQLLCEKYKTRDCDYIISYRGKPVKSLKRAWSTAKKKAGINKRLRLYDLRHAFATYLLSQGADLKAVSELMGHHSTKMTADRYYQLVEKLKKEAVNKLPVFDLSDKSSSQNIRQNIRQKERESGSDSQLP